MRAEHVPPKLTAIERQAGIRGKFAGAVFVKFGEFTNKMLIWHSKGAGYFPTDRMGFSLDGKERRVPHFKLEAALAGK